MVAATAPIAFRWLGRRVFWWGASAPAAAFVWLLTQSDPGDGVRARESLEWVPQLGLDVVLRLDGFGLLMGLIICGIGVAVFAYSWAYFDGHEAPDLGAFCGWLVLFAGSMLGLVLADDVFGLFLFWEATSVTSFFLIGFHHRTEVARSSARQALLVTGLGGLALLAGLVLQSQEAGTTSLSAMVVDPPAASGVVTGAVVLVLVGAFTKSAQVPFHFWLPNAMVAPTPVSAYLHSATMVKAGVYLIARLAPGFAPIGPWRPLVLTVGLATMLLAGWRALFADDLKQLLAFSTISQLGLLVICFGAGDPHLTQAACLMLLAHALAKAALFMVVGIIDHQTGTRDLRRLDGLGARMPIVAVTAAVAAASMAGLPPLLGFLAKEEVFVGLLDADVGASSVVLAGVVIGSALTVAYTLRFCWGAFASKRPSELDVEASAVDVARPSATFVVPASVLAFATLVLGVAPRFVQSLVEHAAAALDPRAVLHTLGAIPHLGPALVMSAAVLAVGTLMFVLRHAIDGFHDRLPRVPSAASGYENSVRGLGVVSERVTGFVQHGSLPVYLAVVFVTFLAIPGSVLAARTHLPSNPEFAPSGWQVAISAMVVGAALATALARRRFAAVLALGSVGYLIAAIFVVSGAPDLAITQLLVETLSVVIFVLVLRRLPEEFPAPRRGQLLRLLIALAVGAMMTMFVLVATGARVDAPVSGELVARSVPDAGGFNVVNVILVDFRGVDTLGEITVLVIAGLGVASLVHAGRTRWRGTAERDLDTERRPSPILDVGVRVMFHTLLLFSLFLLVRGHNRPGGGFAGGLVAGAAFVLLWTVRGPNALATLRIPPRAVLGAGLLTALAAAVTPLVVGGQLLESGKVDVELPGFGTAHLVSAGIFDVGVFLVVLGFVTIALEYLGGDRTGPRAGSTVGRGDVA